MDKQKILKEILKSKDYLIDLTKVKSEKDGFTRKNLKKVSCYELEDEFNKLIVNLELSNLKNPLTNEDLKKSVDNFLTKNQSEVFFDFVNNKYQKKAIQVSDYYTLNKAREIIKKSCEIGKFKELLEPYLRHQNIKINREKKK
jgi:hypothetical protein